MAYFFYKYQYDKLKLIFTEPSYDVCTMYCICFLDFTDQETGIKKVHNLPQITKPSPDYHIKRTVSIIRWQKYLNKS